MLTNDDISLEKMVSYGMFVKINKKVYVLKTNENISGKFYANSDMPQGFYLGPLSFVIFNNYLPSVLNHCHFIIFVNNLEAYKKV